MQHSAKLIVTACIQMISNSQSSWCILRITGNSTVTVKIQWLVESSSWYGYADVLCHVKELIRDMINRLKPSTAFSQINWPKSFLDDLQHTISMMYIESYWLPHSNRQNTVTDWEYLMIWIYWSFVFLKELIRDIINQLKPSTIFSQINWPKSFLDDLQHAISVMYIENYWLFFSNHENTWNGLCGSK